jgi:hypothetical protein
MVVPITTAHFGRDARGVASDEGTGLRGLLPLVVGVNYLFPWVRGAPVSERSSDLRKT